MNAQRTVGLEVTERRNPRRRGTVKAVDVASGAVTVAWLDVAPATKALSITRQTMTAEEFDANVLYPAELQ